MLNVQNQAFVLSNTDRHVFNYTGEQPKDEDDKSTQKFLLYQGIGGRSLKKIITLKNGRMRKKWFRTENRLPKCVLAVFCFF